MILLSNLKLNRHLICGNKRETIILEIMHDRNDYK